MSDDQLFDPAEYGVKLKTPRRVTPDADSRSVTVRPPWVVLRRLKESPRAHRITRNLAVSREFVSYADCGVQGVAITGLGGTDAPACPRCWLAANPEVAL